LTDEDLCLSPLEVFKTLAYDIGVPYNGRIRQTHADLPLAESDGCQAFRAHDVRRNSRETATRWRRELTPEGAARVRSIWGSFDVPLYRGDDAW